MVNEHGGRKVGWRRLALFYENPGRGMGAEKRMEKEERPATAAGRLLLGKSWCQKEKQKPAGRPPADATRKAAGRHPRQGPHATHVLNPSPGVRPASGVQEASAVLGLCSRSRFRRMNAALPSTCARKKHFFDFQICLDNSCPNNYY